jgi:hypothetical protein
MIKDLESVLQSTKCSLNGDLKARVLLIEHIIGILGHVASSELVEMVPFLRTLRMEEFQSDNHNLHCQARTCMYGY